MFLERGYNMKLLKICSKCQCQVTTKNIKSIGRNETGLWVNCQNLDQANGNTCNSTLLFPKKSPVIETFDLFETFLAQNNSMLSIGTIKNQLSLVEIEEISIMNTTQDFTRLLELKQLKLLLYKELNNLLENRKVG